MSLLNVPEYELSNESDVEQKFLYPLLIHASFLAIPASSILTKNSMGTFSFVQKAKLPSNYVPDYTIFFDGLPVCTVEAKSPSETLELAMTEARIYADTLNKQFPNNVNPVALVIGCNGLKLAVGPVDSNTQIEFNVSELLVGTEAVSKLKSIINPTILGDGARKIRAQTRVKKFHVPAAGIDPQLFIERVKPNTLAPYLNPLYEMFFRAEDPEKIKLILDEAYVDTAELRQYDQVLHSMLRQIERAMPGSYQAIQTDKKQEYTLTPELDHYEEDVSSRGRMHLVIGSRGSGKSLFISRFFLHLMPRSMKERAVWCVIDFNRAPSSLDSIESFICEKFLETAENLRFDPHSLNGLKRIFALEIDRLTKGPLAAISDEGERQAQLSKELLNLSGDLKKFALALGRYITCNLHRPLIVAFDNVDRRESGQQLHIFQAAQWFRSETKAFALLTLRDTTFERFKNEPPLDAFAQISNFYIRPPRFALVLQKRLRLAIDVGLKDKKVVEHLASSGARVKYSKDHLGKFLQAVYDALFQGDQQVGRIVDALAEQDVRAALGMFSRILSSGHFIADRIIQIGFGSSTDIHVSTLIKILMRTDYRMFSEQSGFVKNIYVPPENEFSGNLFLTAEILGFFAETQSGGSRLGNYKPFNELLSDLASMGFLEAEIREQTANLVGWKLLVYDGEDNETPSDEDLIKISPSGFIHLRSLPFFIEYIASAAIHIPFDDKAVAAKIAGIWRYAEKRGDIGFAFKHEVASLTADYLIRHKNRVDIENPLFKERSREAEVLVRGVLGTVNSTARVANRLRSGERKKGKKTKPRPAGKK